MNATLPPKLQSVVDTLLQDVRRKLTEDGGIPSTMFLFGDRLVVYEIDANSGRGKDLDVMALRELAKLHNAKAAIMVSEAWTLPAHLQRDDVVEQYGSIADCPDRIEVLILGIESREGDYLVKPPLLRKGRSVKLDTLDVSVKAELDPRGRFHNILPPL